jgi:hypothetical protein
MKLVKGMLLVSMLAAASGAGAVEKAVDAAGVGAGDGAGGMSLAASGSGMSADDEWACKVAMCISNPGGPTEFAECVDPIKRLRRQLAKGKPFPVCPFAGGGSGTQQENGGAQGGGRVGKDERDPLQAL